jgi:4-hydroxy 2-oxovalerate aldolase
MNNHVKLLDCTLRDGGFVNDWKFGRSTMRAIYGCVASAGIDIIELGFIDGRRTFDEDRSIQPNTDDFTHIFSNRQSSEIMRVGMIDFGTCPIENISERENSIFDGIRVIFKKKDIDEALIFCKKIKDKGYELFIQPVSITSYLDSEMLLLIQKVNEISPYAFSIVDTYGLMHREKLFGFFYLIDNNLRKGICIGFHSHNNFQLAYSNSIELLNIKTDRTIVLDGSCYGIGKGAGNANTELLALFLNENCNKNYDLNYILEAIDVNVMPIYQQHYWGYSMNYFLAAANDCHPNYVKNLVDKKTLSIKSTNEILASIEEPLKLSYNEEYISQRYAEYQKHVIDDSKEYMALEKELKNRTILILAPGRMLDKQFDVVQNFINSTNPLIISVNFLPHMQKVDYIFVSNAKRYTQLSDNLREFEHNEKIIITSNIVETDLSADFVFNYDTLLNETTEIVDTSMIMILKLLERLRISEVFMAGFDGFTQNGVKNYLNTDLMFDADMQFYKKKNEAINDELHKFNELKINFITKTEYRIGE